MCSHGISHTPKQPFTSTMYTRVMPAFFFKPFSHFNCNTTVTLSLVIFRGSLWKFGDTSATFRVEILLNSCLVQPDPPELSLDQVKQGHKRMVYYRFTNTERIFPTELQITWLCEETSPRRDGEFSLVSFHLPPTLWLSWHYCL